MANYWLIMLIIMLITPAGYRQDGRRHEVLSSTPAKNLPTMPNIIVWSVIYTFLVKLDLPVAETIPSLEAYYQAGVKPGLKTVRLNVMLFPIYSQNGV